MGDFGCLRENHLFNYPYLKKINQSDFSYDQRQYKYYLELSVAIIK